jgi:hypothetical protein
MHPVHEQCACAGLIRGSIGIDKHGQTFDPQYSHRSDFVTARSLPSSTPRSRASSETREKLGAMGIDVVASSPEQFKQTIKDDATKLGAAIKAAGTRLKLTYLSASEVLPSQSVLGLTDAMSSDLRRATQAPIFSR